MMKDRDNKELEKADMFNYDLDNIIEEVDLNEETSEEDILLGLDNSEEISLEPDDESIENSLGDFDFNSIQSSEDDTEEVQLDIDDSDEEDKLYEEQEYEEIELDADYDENMNAEKVSLDIGRVSIYLKGQEHISDDELDDIDLNLDKEYDIDEDSEVYLDEVELSLEDSDKEESAFETAQRKIKSKIGKCRAERNNTPIEDSIDAVNSYISEAKSELQGYINNIHESFKLNNSTPETAELLELENLDKRYFVLLSNIYAAFYREQKSEYEIDYTPDKFLEQNIYSVLQEYAKRRNDGLARALEGRTSITAVELLGNESLIVQLTDMLYKTYEKLNKRLIDESKNKSKLKIINASLIKRSLQLKIRPETECVYPESITVSNDGESYVCGKCNQTVKADRPFYTFGLLPYQGVTGDRNYSYKIITIPGINVCPHCKVSNILCATELKRLASADKSMHREYLRSFTDYCKQASSQFNLTKYMYNAELLANVLPHLYSNGTEEMSLEKTTEEPHTVLNTSDALARYRNLLNFFRAKTNLDISPTNYTLPSLVNVSQISDFVITNTDIDKNVEILYSKGGMYNLTKLIKIICGCVGANYKEVKENAINSLNTFIINSPLYPLIAYNQVELSGIVAKSSNIVNYIDGLSESDTEELIPVLGGYCSYDMKLLLNSDGKVNKSEIPKLKKALSKYFDKLKKFSEDSETLRDEILVGLQRNTRLYSYIPIVKIPMVDTTKISELMYSEKYRDFVEQTTNLMILNKYIERFFKFWRGIAPKKAVSALTSLSDINKMNNSLYCETLCRSTNALSFVSRTNKSKKYKVYADIFTTMHDIDYEELNILDKVQKAFTEGDEFSLMNSIAMCDFVNMRDAYGKMYETSVYKTVCQTIEALQPKAIDFVNKFGRTEKDRMFYYLGDMFTQQEIEEGYEGKFSKIKLKYIVPRQDNETFREYMLRLGNMRVENFEIGKFTRCKHKIFDSCLKHADVLCACDLPTVYYVSNVSNLAIFTTLIDFFYYILQRNLRQILCILGIDIQVATKLSNVCDVTIKTESKRRKDAKYYLLRSIYLNNSFNLTGDLSDLINEEELSVDSSIDVDTTEEERIDILLNDIDRFKEASKHLPEEVLNTINEFYPIGR